MNYYIGADLGTSALKLILMDCNLQIVRTVTKEYEVIYPFPGWSEQRPQDWWEAFVGGVQELTASMDKTAIRGIAVAGQMHGLVILDEKDEVIRPAILWNDTRTKEETEYLNSVIGEDKLAAHTGNIAFAGFTAPKLLWLKKHERHHFDRISKIMLPKDYITYRITGVHATDYSDASGMLLLDVRNKCWSDPMLSVCSVTKEQMPKLYESYESVGTVLPGVADELGLSLDVTVAAGAGDNAGAAIGTGTAGEGKCNISLGTSGTVFVCSESFKESSNNAIHQFCHADGKYHFMGCILSAASCNKWFCGEVLQEEDYAKVQAGITEDMLGKNDLFFVPYLMGERSPVNDADATGVFIGLRPDTSRYKMLQAVLEGVAFAIRDNVEVANKSSILIKEAGVCGGGAKSKLWLTILANILNMKLSVPQTDHGPGYGAAILAMAAAGKETEVIGDVSAYLQPGETVVPTAALAGRYDEKYQKYKEIYPHLKSLFKIL